MLQRIASLLRMKPPSVTTRGLLSASGLTVPTDGVDGYQTGCIFQHTDGTLEGALYVNEGSVTSADFNALVPAGSAELSDLSDVGATDYSAGELLVADGDSFEQVAISNHATLASSGALTIAGVSKTFTISLSSFHPGGSGLDAVNVMTATAQADGAELGLAVTAGANVVGLSTNNTDATNHMVIDWVVPEDYVATNNITVRIRALMSAAANATSDLDVVVKHIKAGALDATDLVTTAAQDIKAVVAAADHDFIVNSIASGDEISPGDILHIAISAQRDDTGGSTAGTVIIHGVQVIANCYR